LVRSQVWKNPRFKKRNELLGSEDDLIPPATTKHSGPRRVGSNGMMISESSSSLQRRFPSQPLALADRETDATAAGATGANNIGALTEANNPSDAASASSARINLGSVRWQTLGSVTSSNVDPSVATTSASRRFEHDKNP